MRFLVEARLAAVVDHGRLALSISLGSLTSLPLPRF
uniref:Uncharacterized protein n=1 Tax=Setaria viridis TaxID=4556 RepID=A0A4U6UVN4_SETVI|nr:hypothetical protein SEVIR_4G099401v2 [Setaria viridis]